MCATAEVERAVQYRVRVKLCASDDKRELGFGRGIVMLLEGVERLGSLNAIAKEMGMAYSKAWTVVKRTEEEFGVELLVREGQRGSTVTEQARLLMACYHEMLRTGDEAVKAVFEKHYGGA